MLWLFLTRYSFLPVSGQAQAVFRHRPVCDALTGPALLDEDLFVYSVFKIITSAVWPNPITLPWLRLGHSVADRAVRCPGPSSVASERPLWPMGSTLPFHSQGLSLLSDEMTDKRLVRYFPLFFLPCPLLILRQGLLCSPGWP